jgi:DNA gyrase subunit A
LTDLTTPRGPQGGPDDIEPISIIEEMQRSYLDYAMSVIVSRALPDVRDGLKPVHRRILYASHESAYYWNRKYVKSARPVADMATPRSTTRSCAWRRTGRCACR